MSHRHTVVSSHHEETASWLAGHLPRLAAAYHAAHAGAREAVLARLWGALAREPIPGVAGRQHDGGDLVVQLSSGRRLRGPAAAAVPFAVAPFGAVGGDAHDCLTLTETITGPGSSRGTGTADAGPDTATLAHTDPAALLRSIDLPGQADRLADELDGSVANLALARAAQPRPDPETATLLEYANHLAARGDTLVRAEQLVVDGHPLHPCCRTRIGMSPSDLLAYAPEHRPTVLVELVHVPARKWMSTGTGLPPVLPMHPWQWARLREEYPWLRHTGRTLAARPLMSLRTFALRDDPRWHLKTAVDVQMTGAVRTVSPAAVHNGPLVGALLAELCRDVPGIDILREVAAGAVVVDGEPCRSLAFVRREAPRLAPGEIALPMAALAAAAPTRGRSFAAGLVSRGYGGKPAPFFADLVRLLLPPLLLLLHRGVALEAHGQNTVLILRDGRPARLLYRDVGGLRLSPRRLARHGVQPPPVRGDLASDDPAILRSKLFAAAVSTVVGELVALLGREYGLEAAPLWETVAAVARGAFAVLPAAAGTDGAALFGEPLPVKAMTAMRLADRPTDEVWASLPNPLAGL